VHRDYVEARALLESGRVNASQLVTHVFSLSEFNRAVAIQGDPRSKALKVVIKP
jgi:threonine dehydrogenase-like Zn-dependent dehydrogenase